MTKPIAFDAYEQIADAFAARVDWYAWNAHYDRPATLSLLPEVRDRRVLDAGCGPGAYTEWLVERGAQVVAVDTSPRMIAHACRRLGPRAEVRLANLDEPLDFLSDHSFDMIVSGLVLDYIRDWHALFREFFRVLRAPGTLVFSIEHPCSAFTLAFANNYFETELVRETWDSFGEPLQVPTYRRPISAIVNTLVETGFTVDRILEPQPTVAFEQAKPEDYQQMMRRPGFLCVRAVKK
jgi:SAM-dependent methyltransferase